MSYFKLSNKHVFCQFNIGLVWMAYLSLSAGINFYDTIWEN